MRVLDPAIVYICDPIFGDDPTGLYIDAAAARAVLELLVPSADILTPNRFELSWLSGVEVASVDQAVRAARSLARPKIAATSIPAGASKLANVLVGGESIVVVEVDKLPDVPHGTGDLFAGFFVAGLLTGAAPEPAFCRAVDGVRHALDVSRGSDRLLLPLIDWAKVAPVDSGHER
jgi:pyridoxine kinase